MLSLSFFDTIFIEKKNRKIFSPLFNFYKFLLKILYIFVISNMITYIYFSLFSFLAFFCKL
ncbi:hypothetical protein BKN39_06685 [Fusobacterium nucleatum]|nr:hypothetical protein BKN39_06685 [Fusobacterium nucleatum]